LKLRVNYISAKEEGFWEQWYDDGSKKSKSNFKNGVKQGEEIIWNRDGSERYKRNYINGKIIK
jgi:antitoxin component YwqK of YwqJK toxin-antitoxin module